ncbi:MAG: transcriptional regulator, partial [Alphaproteobacteria bacterium]
MAVRFSLDRDSQASPPREAPHDSVGFVVPMPGQDVSGDGVCFATTDAGQDRILMCDGLGHGQAAHDASQKAIEIFRECGDRSASATVSAIDSGIAGTRGAVALVVEMAAADYPAIAAVGVGNITGQIVSPKRTRHIISFDGTLGRGARKVERLSYDDLEWRAVILATDGVRMRWNFDDYPGLLSRTPLTVAATLW